MRRHANSRHLLHDGQFPERSAENNRNPIGLKMISLCVAGQAGLLSSVYSCMTGQSVWQKGRLRRAAGWADTLLSEAKKQKTNPERPPTVRVHRFVEKKSSGLSSDWQSYTKRIFQSCRSKLGFYISSILRRNVTAARAMQKKKFFFKSMRIKVLAFTEGFLQRVD